MVMDDWQDLPFKRFTDMDYGSMIGESFEYAKEAVVGKWNKWLMLIIATILLAIPLMGYAMKVLRGEKPAPEVDDWGTLFIDGIKYLIVSLIYALPIIIVWILVLGASDCCHNVRQLLGNDGSIRCYGSRRIGHVRPWSYHCCL